MPPSLPGDTDAALLERVADAVLERRIASEPLLALSLGRAVRGLAALSPAAVESDAAFFSNMLEQLSSIDAASLPPAKRALLGALRFDLSHRVASAGHRLLDFVVTPYRGGDLHVEVRAALSACRLDTAEGQRCRTALLHDYTRLIGEITDRTIEQRDCGILLAARALGLARTTIDDILRSADEAVRPALRRLREVLDHDYAAKAPTGVGLHLYPGGEAAYQELIAARADTKATPEVIHALGLDAMACLEAAKSELHGRIGGSTTRAEFEHRLMNDPKWIASSPAEVESRYLEYLRRMEPQLPHWFGRLPKAPWGIERADQAIEAGMSFGYYERPTAAQPVGRYRYNGTHLAERSMVGAQHLIYHELLPGHHLQLSLQTESAMVHPLQAHLQSMAAVEGWAEYASELAREMDLYDDCTLYGHYVMRSFLAARLVVDTGLNALGWSLERARKYLREHTLEGAGVIESELLRYSTDIPAQALAYELGHRAIQTARLDAAEQLGGRFDIRGFHDAVLEVGGFPLPVMRDRVDAWVAAT